MERPTPADEDRRWTEAAPLLGARRLSRPWFHPPGFLGEAVGRGLLLTLAAVVAFEVLVQAVVPLPTLAALLAVVAFVAYKYGLGSGLASAVIMSAYGVHYFAEPGQRFQYSHDNALRLVILPATAFALAVIVGTLRRSQRATEARLRQQRDVARALDASLDEGVYALDREGRVTFLNPAAERLLGWTEAELRGRVMHDVIHFRYPDGRPYPREACSGLQVLRAGVPYRTEDDAFVRKDGTMLPVAFSSAPIKVNGQVAGAVIAFRDVSERKQAQEALEASNRKVTNILESITDAFYALDHAWCFTYVNPQAERLLRHTGEELLGRSVWEVYPEAVGMTVYHKYHQAVAEQVALTFEEYYPPLETWFELHIYPGLDGLAVYFRDINERKRAERELEVRACQQQAVAAFGEHALTTRDVAAVMDEAVAVVARTLGVEHARIMELLPDGNALVLRAGVGWKDRAVGRQTVGGGRSSQSGYTLCMGEPVVVVDTTTEERFAIPALLREHGVVSSVSVIVHGHNRPFGVLSAETTVRRTFTEDDIHFLQAVANVLSAAVRRKEFEEQLAREQAEAERLAELDRLRADFFAAISHDLRTPLTAIQAGVGLLEQSVGERLRPEEAALLSNARRNAERLNRLIEDLLTANQLEAGTLTLERKPLDLRAVVADAAASLHPLVQGKGQTLALDLPAPLPLCGDAHRLGQVVINLVANAHRHTPPGTRISVCGRVEAAEVQLSVADDGPGIPPDQREAIFQRFHRLDPSGGGSGLGLAIARGIIEGHGGRIWAEQAPGGGAVFQCVVPGLEPEGSP